MMPPADFSSAQPSTNSTLPANGERLLLRLVTAGILIALALAVVLLRLQRLDELPPGLYSHEGIHGLNALRILRGEHSVFFPEKAHGTEGLMAYVATLFVSLLGRTELALRLPAALAGGGTLFVVFWLGQLLFGRDEESGQATPYRGIFIGGVAASLLAVSIGQTVLGRTAFRVNLLTCLLCLCLALIWKGWRRREPGSARAEDVGAAVCAGLLPYTYIAARFTPILFLLFGLTFLLPFRRCTMEHLRKLLPRVGLFLGVSGLVAAPILVYFVLHPEDFFLRSNQLLVFRSEIGNGDPLGTLLRSVWDHLLLLGFRGDPDWRRNFPNQPLLNPWQAFFFWLGAGMAAVHWRRRPAYRLLFLWMLVMFLPAMLAKETPSPNSVRMNGATPAIFLLVGVGMWEAFQFLKDRFFRNNVAKAAVIAGTLVSVAILVQGVNTYYSYFHKWPAATGPLGRHEMVWEELTRWLNSQPSGPETVHLIPISYHHESLEYLYQGVSPVRLIFTNRHDLPQSIESTLASGKEIATVKAVDWDDDLVSGIYNIDERLFTLLGKYGRYVESEEYDNFRIHSFTDIVQDRSWTLYQQLGPPEIHYDGGISLNGVALGHSDEQEAPQQIIDLGESRTLWMVLQWQVAPGLQIDYSTSIRLHDAEGRGVYQKDALLHNWDYETTRQWTAHETADTLYFLVLPADLPAGEYELRMVVYDIDTVKPTVEMGVWESEKVLARLRLREKE